ncbi:MAG: hypothetical protein M0Z99_23260 [Betaproteobacteria bacterium]|nr:hypothetical protein [Betaproteobacteria bacterium]
MATTLTAAALQYYTGQGKVWIATRQGQGGPINGPWRFVGDAPELMLDFGKQKMIEIEESITGFGGTSAFYSVAIPSSFTLQLLSWQQENLQLALYGTYSGANAGGTVSAEAATAYPSGQFYAQNIGISNVAVTPVAGQVGSIAVTQGAGYTTAPTVAIAAPPAGGVQATAVATLVSAADITIQITNPGSGYTAAPAVTLTGGGSTTAATATATLTTATALVLNTDYTLSASFGAIVPIPTSTFWAQLAPTAPVQVTLGYTYAANQGTVNPLAGSQQEVAIRVDGLNVANPQPGGLFGAVAIELKRCALQLPKSLGLLSKKEEMFPLDGMTMLDPTATDGAPYMKITQA